jgi:hypothetical protein
VEPVHIVEMDAPMRRRVRRTPETFGHRRVMEVRPPLVDGMRCLCFSPHVSSRFPQSLPGASVPTGAFKRIELICGWLQG